MSKSTDSALPRVLLTPGEPAGIGPDITATIASQPFDGELVAVADPELLTERAAMLGVPLRIRDADGSAHQPGSLSVLPVPLRQKAVAGVLSPVNAAYVVETITKATELCVRGDYDALCTAPVHKAIINEGGIDFSGHTELLAQLCQIPQPVMLLAAGDLRVALATTHLPLAKVSAAITKARLQSVITVLLHDLTHVFGIQRPRVAVCGLNPHAGESGLLGSEEADVIEPVIRQFIEAGHAVHGPVPADTAFTKNELSRVDAVLSMFHDQGLPVVKHQGFGEAVNVTLGLPIVRTSVDHGTAVELAGTGRAQSGSLATALQLAGTLARSRGIGK